MTDDTTNRDDETAFGDLDGPPELQPVDAGDDLEQAPDDAHDAAAAEAAEAEAAAEEEWGGDGDYLDDDEANAHLAIQEAMESANAASLEARATWSLIHKEHLILLFANILFFVGVLAAWERPLPGVDGDPSTYIRGLDTIRGSVIFALSLFGFWTVVFNIWFRQLKIWPFLISALFALWVGIPGITRTFSSGRWEDAWLYMESLPTKTMLDKYMIPLSSIPPAFWLLTAGGAIVLVILLKGILGGMSSAKQAGGTPAEAGGRRRR